jgi:long-chain acyl-CoA synthetase
MRSAYVDTLVLNRRRTVGIEQLPPSAGDALELGLGQYPDRHALVASDRRLTYGELDAAVEVAAGYLYRRGVRAGDRVAVSLPNTSQIVVVFYAVMRLGAVWVGVNTNLAPPEKAYLLQDSEARHLVGTAEAVGELDTGVLGDLGVQYLAADDFPPEREAPAEYPRPVGLFDTPAGIAYTSGTTGRPKGVVHTHRNLLLPGAVLGRLRGFDLRLRRGDCAALTILNLQVTSTLLTAQAGGTQVVMDRVDPVGMAHWIRSEQVTSWFGVPTMLLGLARHPEVQPGDLSSLEDIWTGGADLPESIREEFESKFGRLVHATYGLTEVPTVVTIEARGEPHRPGSSGQVLPHLEVGIDPGVGHDQPGDEGEIVISATTTGEWANAYRPMTGYYGAGGRPEGDPLRTGDIGTLDSEGNLFIRGRRTSLILRGGSNVYPAEIERVILQLSQVDGVAVVGYPDERLGQRVGAAVELRGAGSLSVEELTAHCRRSLARYKVPDAWRFAKLPRNAMGKVIANQVGGWFEIDGAPPSTIQLSPKETS